MSKLNKSPIISYILCIMVVFGSFFVDPGTVLGDKTASATFDTEVTNDYPDVTFTATGIATEPSPINSVGFSPSTLKGWTNSSLDNYSMRNNWGTNGDTLIAPRRTSVFGYSSFPSNVNSSEAYTLQYPTGGYNCTSNSNYCTIFKYLGNDRYLITYEYSASDRRIYLSSPYSAPVLLFNGCYTNAGEPCQHSAYSRVETDEIIINAMKTTDASYSSGRIGIDWNYRVYKLSDLQNGIISLKRTGNYKSRNYTNSGGIVVSGTYPAFSDGAQQGASRLYFDSDYKEINLTTRTIKSYSFDNRTSPYKTETYNNIPAAPQASSNQVCNGVFLCQKTKPDTDIYLTKKMMSPNGEYIAVIDGNIYKFDRLTAQPSYLSNIVKKDYSEIKISTDGEYIWEHYVDPDPYCYNDDDGCEPSIDRFINTIDGSVLGYNPYPNANWPYFLPTFTGNSNIIGQTGWGLSYSNSVSAYTLGDAKVSHASSTLTDTKELYIETNSAGDGRFYSGGEIYTYTPESNQTPISNEAFTLGQLYNTGSQQVRNGTVSWSLRYHQLDHINAASGVSFRIQDHKNMYRVEAAKDKLNLLKIVNGRKYTLQSVNRTIFNEQWISYKVKISGDKIIVYENGGKLIDLTDGTFSDGTMGPFSTADNTEFKGISFQWSDADNSYNTPGVAIVDTAVTYATTFDDPENDPMVAARSQWRYEHIDPNMFLNANDGKSGLSGYHNSTVTNPILTFDRVGLYKIYYRVPDDPHPGHRIANGDLMFQNYSLYSDWYPQNLIVHRIPISLFTLWQDPTTLQVIWTDNSYDPDRCFNAGNCTNGYTSNHGIFKKKFYYITPTGNKVDGKLVRPTESGIYTVAMAVADEYNAWSTWYETTIQINIPAAPNNPPAVTLTFPNGSYSNPSYVSLFPTITWNQSDPDANTIFTAFDISIKDEWGNCVECMTNRVMDTTNNSWAWTMNNSLEMGRKYQVQVRVSDGESWSGWSSIGWMGTNSPPSAFMSFPYGTQDNPTIINTLRPTLTWLQTDPDAGAVFNYFQIEITNEANNITILDSGKMWQGTSSKDGSWTVLNELPTGQKMRVRVMVWDQFGAESAWSSQTWMMINRPPQAAFTWSPSVVYEGDPLQLIDGSNDPDGDALTYEWTIQAPDGNVTTSNLKQPVVIQPALVGNYTVTLRVTDIHGMSDQVTHTIPVLPLTITGKVSHIPRWEALRQESNLEKSNNAETPWKQNQFLAGEPFQLHADTTVIDPGSTVYAQKVEVTWDQTDRIMLAATTPPSVWEGEMWNESFTNLNPTTAVFTFRVTYSNGTVKSTTVPIEILDKTIEQFWMLKRDK